MQRLPEHVEQWHYKGITVCGTDIPLTHEDIGDHTADHFHVEAIFGGDPNVLAPIGFRIKNPLGLLFADPTMNGLAQLAVRAKRKPEAVFELFTRLLVTEKLQIGSPGLARHILVALQEMFAVPTDPEDELHFHVSYILILLRKLDDRMRIVL